MEVPMNLTYGLQPSYHGFVVSTYDALVLFEACFCGYINHVSRRPHDRERVHIIKSGNVFLYEENTSGIKRWTDGVSWSPSRILSNFLIYRQLQKAFPPGQKKKAKKPLATNKSASGSKNGVTKNGSQAAKSNINVDGLQRMFPSGPPDGMTMFNPDLERSLVGSLTESYDFLDGGLVKKTISIIHSDITHHLVSYYTVADALARGKFLVPSRDPRLLGLTIRPTLLDGQTFRTSVDDIDPLERAIYEYYGGYDVPAPYFGPVGPPPPLAGPFHPAPGADSYAAPALYFGPAVPPPPLQVHFHPSPGADSYQSPMLPPQLSQPLLQGPYDNNHITMGSENQALIPMSAMADAPFDSRLSDPNFGFDNANYYEPDPPQRTVGFGPSPLGLEFNTGYEEDYQTPQSVEPGFMTW